MDRHIQRAVLQPAQIDFGFPQQGVGEKIGARLDAEVQKRGLFTRQRGDVLFIAPPVVTTEAQLDRIVEIISESVKAVRS